MQLSDLIEAGAVRSIGSVTSKKRLFQEIGEISFAAYGIKADNVIQALQERETLGPTGVGHGIALPHARLDGIDGVRGVFVRLEKALEFEAIDRQPVDLIFALLAPLESGVEHLKALALVSRTMRDAGLCAKLRANTNPAIIHTVLTEAPRVQAA